jgi:hypothetical protein
VSKEDFIASYDEMKDEVIRMVEQWKLGPPYLDPEGQEIGEGHFIALLAGKLAIVATMGITIETEQRASPAIWLGEVAGMLLQSETAMIEEMTLNYVAEKAREARDN